MIDVYPELSREPAIVANPQWLKEYVTMREAGEPHGFSAMIVMQQPPGCISDNTYCSGRGTLDDQLGSEQAANLTKIAERNGYRPNVRDVYEPGLARFQGDPQAFVPQSGGRAHIKKVLNDRGYDVRAGGVGVTNGITAIPRQPESPPMSKPLAEDLIRDNANAILKREPDKRKLSTRELRDLVVERHGKPSRELPVTKN